MTEFDTPEEHADADGKGGSPYGLVVAFYPMVQTPSPKTRRPRAKRTSQEPSR